MRKIFPSFQDHTVFGGVANIQEIKYFARFEALMVMMWDVVPEGGGNSFFKMLVYVNQTT
jgi:hypothetical protein